MCQRRRFKLAACMSLFGLVACNAIAGLDGEFIESSDGSAPPSTTDGGQDGKTPQDGQVIPTDGPSPTDGQKSDGDGSEGTDSGVDACSKQTSAVSPATIATPSGDCAGSYTFCWDFNKVPDAAFYGWASSDTTAGGALEQTTGTLHVLHGSAAPAGSGSSLTWLDWDTRVDHPSPADPIPVVLGSPLRLELSVKLAQSARPGTILAFDFGNESYGLALYKDPCGGATRVGPIVDDPESFVGGVVLDPGKWYRAFVYVTFDTKTAWHVETRIGATFVNSTLLSNVTGNGDLTDGAVGPKLTTGLFRLGQGATQSEVFLDNILLKY